MTANDTIEQRLTAMLDAPMTPELRAHLRDRVGQTVLRAPMSRTTPVKRSLRRATILALAAALVVATGTIAADLFGRILFQPGWETAWQDSVEIGQEQTVGGEVIRLERGYADSNQVILGWTGTLPEGVSGAQNQTLTDTAGRAYRLSDGAGTDAVPGGVTLSTFLPVDPLPAGDTVFMLTLADEVSFTFTLPVLGGTEVAIGGTVIASDFAVTLEEFRVGSSSLLAYLSLEALQGAPDGEAWTPIGHVEVDGRTIDLPAVRDGEDRTLIASAVEGVENAAGTWRIVIDEIVGHNGQWPDNEQIRVDGPWVFEFEVSGS